MDLDKIISWYFSEDQIDKLIALGQIKTIVGKDNLEANLFMIEFYRLDNDTGFYINHENFAKAEYKTFKISFGKNYRYNVTFLIKYKGEIAYSDSIEFSRYQIGNEEAYDILYAKTRDYLTSKGFILNKELIISAYRRAKKFENA